MGSSKVYNIQRPWVVVEGVLLATAAPFLLFPTIRPWITAIFTVLLLLFYVLQRALTGQKIFLQTPSSIALGVWAAAVTIGLLVSSNPELSIPKATGLLLGFAVWRFLINSVQTQRALYWSTAALFITGTVLVVVGVISADWKYQAPFVERVLTTLPPQLILLPEAPAAGTHTNQLAGTMIIFLPLLFTALLKLRPRRYRKILVAGLIIFTLVWISLLILTQSRSAWLAAIASTFVFLLLWALTLPNSSRRWIAWSILVIGTGLIILTLTAANISLEELWKEPPIETAIGTLSTIDSRKEIWHWAMSAIYDFPITGPGLGTFRKVVHHWYPLAIPISQDFAHAHNIFLQVALDSGLPGLTAYIALLGIALKLTWQMARSMPSQRALAIGLSASMLSIHLFGLTDALAPGSKPGIIFWMLLGIIGAQWKLTGKV